MKIIFKNYKVPSVLKNKNRVRDFLVSIFEVESVDFQEITYVFCNDSYLLDLNESFLNHDTLTDILTFQLSDVNKPAVAEIYISIERVRENSSYYKTTFNQELMRVIIHGVLHLCGYKDKTRLQKNKMRLKENFYLLQYGFT